MIFAFFKGILLLRDIFYDFVRKKFSCKHGLQSLTLDSHFLSLWALIAC